MMFANKNLVCFEIKLSFMSWLESRPLGPNRAEFTEPLRDDTSRVGECGGPVPALTSFEGAVIDDHDERESMADWKHEELAAIGAAEELRIASRRADGTLRSYVPIWHAVVDGDLYVRSAYGPQNGWYRRAARAGAGRISAGGVERDATFDLVDAGAGVHADIDAELRRKYASYPAYVAPIVTAESHTATLRIVPRD
jgi:hypothetical protein